jgi:Uma2 family endonuclease
MRRVYRAEWIFIRRYHEAMGTLNQIPFPVFTFEEYLAKNERSSEKLEYLHGTVFAMAGGSQFHNAIGVNCIVALSNRLLGGECRVMSSDQMVSTPAQEAAFYPDLMVICGERLLPRSEAITSPVVVVEVLSPSTRAFDLSEKLKQYKRIASLRHIVFVESTKIEVLSYSREAGEVWPGSPDLCQDLESSLALSALGVDLPLREIYLDVEFSA